jgi:iron complex transport system ATP-binding protein
MVAAQGVKFRFPDSGFTLQCDNFVARSGEIACIMGPNGSGKTTFLRLLYGELRPISGTIEVDRVKSVQRGYRTRLRWINVAGPGDLVATLTVGDHMICAVAANGGKLPKCLLRKYPELVPLTALDSIGSRLWRDVRALWEKRISELSSGQTQLVSTVMSVLYPTRNVLADESTAHLDPSNSFQLFEAFRTLALGGGCYVVVTHNVFVAARFADRVYGCVDGIITPLKVAEGRGLDAGVSRRIEAMNELFNIGVGDAAGSEVAFGVAEADGN